MSSSRVHRVGPPRLDPTQRLRHRLYEPLTLLWMLSAARGPAYVMPTAPEHSQDFLSQWRAFLDALSWFCDFDHGGRTVSSVAGEAVASGNRFWLSCRHENALPHLQHVLRLLENVGHDENLEQTEVSRRIAEDSIQRSKAKVDWYVQTLQRKLDIAHTSTENNHLPGKSPRVNGANLWTYNLAGTDELVRALTSIISLRGQPLLICQAALSFSWQDLLNWLVEATTTIRTTSPWSAVRHYLARLRSWFRKSVLLVKFAKRFPAILEHHSCTWLRLPTNFDFPASDSKTNLLSALGRMLPQADQNKARELLASLSSLRDFDFEATFAENYKAERLSLATHSEVFLMEHFYFNALRPVENDRYIGCSKLSCYCCSLYMRYHPGNFVVRPSHGTAWVSWSPPLQSKIEDEAIRKHNLDIINKVVDHLRRDVMMEIETRFPRRLRLPDSSSGLGTRSF